VLFESGLGLEVYISTLEQPLKQERKWNHINFQLKSQKTEEWKAVIGTKDTEQKQNQVW
jgi:hypothetical protein